ncbi:MAG: DUF3108 domain-containing protein [Planctomycetota bacterium]
MNTSSTRLRWLAVAGALLVIGGGIAAHQAFFSGVPPLRTDGQWPCKLRYEMGWNALSCASFQVRLDRDRYLGKKSIKMSFSGGTLPVIDWAWQYRANGFSYLDPGSALPYHSLRRTRVEDEDKMVVTRFNRAEGTLRSFSIEEQEEGQDSLTTQCRPGLDLQGAFLYLGRLDWQSRETRTLEVVDEDERYKIVLRRLGRERVSVEAGTFDAVKVDLSLRETGDVEKDEKSASEKYRTIHVWFSRTQPRVPVKMQSEVFVGSVGAELTSLCCDAHCGSAQADGGRPNPVHR